MDDGGPRRRIGPVEIRAVAGSSGLDSRPVVARTVVRTVVIRPVVGLHRRPRHGTAVVGTDVVPMVVGRRTPRGDVVVRTDQVDGIDGAAERIIGVDGSAAVIPVNGVAGTVIHVGAAGAAAAVGAGYAEALIIGVIAAGQGAGDGRCQQ